VQEIPDLPWTDPGGFQDVMDRSDGDTLPRSFPELVPFAGGKGSNDLLQIRNPVGSGRQAAVSSSGHPLQRYMVHRIFRHR
jgi:hypothetical protein